jgi:DNA-binding NarL/FixJ family response regulator
MVGVQLVGQADSAQERELEIFTRLASGHSNQQIGYDLVPNANTVSNLGTSSRHPTAHAAQLA